MQQRAAVHGARRSDPNDESLHAARLSAVVELIKKLTGRDVKLVPPSPYLVSGPVRPEPVTVEVAKLELADVGDGADEPIEVDITEVIERGTSARMRLSDGEHGALRLRPDLDLAM